MDVRIEAMEREDWPQVRAIYAEGIETGLAAFVETAADWEEWNANHLEIGRFVARGQGEILGWAALSGVNSN